MIDERLTRDIEMGAKARPAYKTDVITTDGGFEWRNQRWRYPKFTFEFNIEPGNPDDDPAYYAGEVETLNAFINLFHVAGGQNETFKFRHWRDYQGVDEPIGTGDGATVDFQLYRVYRRGSVTRSRKITRPVADTVVVKVAGVETAVTVDDTTGIVTFGSAPALNAAITASFEFDIPVRFASDELEFVAMMTDLDQPVNIELIEVRE